MSLFQPDPAVMLHANVHLVHMALVRPMAGARAGGPPHLRLLELFVAEPKFVHGPMRGPRAALEDLADKLGVDPAAGCPRWWRLEGGRDWGHWVKRRG